MVRRSLSQRTIYSKLPLAFARYRPLGGLVSLLWWPGIVSLLAQWYRYLAAYRIYSIKRRSQLSAAYESKNIKESHPRISAAFIHNNAALNRSIIRLNPAVLEEPK